MLVFLMKFPNSICAEPAIGTTTIVVAVAHVEFKMLGATKLRTYSKSRHILFDVKYVST